MGFKSGSMSPQLIDLVSTNKSSIIAFVCTRTNYILILDGCRSTTTPIPSVSGDGNLTIIITWPETNLAEVAEVTCPCGTLNITAQVATRRCGGNFINGAKWDTPNIDPCNLSDNARRICQLSEVMGH